MNHIVLVNIENNTEKVHRQFSPPFGILIAASVLQRNNVEVIVRHIVNTKENLKELLRVCEGAIAVGFSVMTSPNLLSVIEASKLLHNQGIFVYWAGTHATLLPKISLQDSCVDAVLRGEAEQNLYEFYLWRQGKISADSVPGLCYIDNGEIRISPIPAVTMPDTLGYHPFDLLDMNKYLDKPIQKRKNYIPGKILPFMTSKGCVKRCAFCYNTVVNRSKWRGYPLHNVYKEMDYLIDNYGVTGWMFYDDNIFVDPTRAWSIIEKYKMPTSVELDLMRVDEALVERALSSNVAKLYIGIESGSDKMLRKMHKGITRAKVIEKMQMCQQMGIHVDLSFMMLLPGESPEDLELTLSLVKELDEYDNIKIDGPKCYNPYPGTEFFDELLASGWKEPTSNEEWAKYNRNIAVGETGFNLSEEHIRLLEDYHLL